MTGIRFRLRSISKWPLLPITYTGFTYSLIILVCRLTQPNTTEWRQAHRLYTQAFKSPPTPSEQKKLAKILKRPLTDELQKELDKEMFDYDEGFLRGLGKMNLSEYHRFPFLLRT